MDGPENPEHMDYVAIDVGSPADACATRQCLPDWLVSSRRRIEPCMRACARRRQTHRYRKRTYFAAKG